MPLSASINQTLPDEFRVGFDDTILQAVQQEDEKFAGMAMVDSSWIDNQKVWTEIGTQDWTKNNARFGVTNPDETLFDNRAGFKQKIEKEVTWDKWDESFFRSLGNLESPVMKAINSGRARIRDQVFIDALTATSYGGDEPAYNTPYAFPSSNIIAVGDVPLGINAGGTTTLGLTPGKIMNAIRKMEEANVDINMPLFLAMGPRQKQDLVEYSQVYKNDIWAKQVMDWMNNNDIMLFGHTVKPVMSTQLALSGANVRTAVLFAKEAMIISPYEQQQYVTRRVERKFVPLIAQYGLWGVMRVRDEMVYQILCDEDTTPSGTLASVS